MHWNTVKRRILLFIKSSVWLCLSLNKIFSRFCNLYFPLFCQKSMMLILLQIWVTLQKNVLLCPRSCLVSFCSDWNYYIEKCGKNSTNRKITRKKEMQNSSKKRKVEFFTENFFFFQNEVTREWTSDSWLRSKINSWDKISRKLKMGQDSQESRFRGSFHRMTYLMFLLL